MTAVLVEAQGPGPSGWSFLRDRKKVRVSGLAGGIVELHFSNGAVDVYLELSKDGYYEAPENVSRVRARLLSWTERTRASVDLEI